MTRRRILPSLTSVVLVFGFIVVVAGYAIDAAQEDPAPPATKDAAKPAPVRRAKKARPANRPANRGEAGGVPLCTEHRRSSSPPPRSMPELFDRMGQSFASNPQTGFNTFLSELARMEEPAVLGITVSLDEERRTGRRAREDYLARARERGYRVVTDAARLDYVESLVDRLAARMAHRERYPKIDVTLITAPIPDGQSFPGGSLVFTTGLLDEPDEATVAGVVAHELAHLDLGHLYGYVRRSKLAETSFSRMANQPVSFDQFFTQQAALLGMMMNPFRPEHESEADCAAVTWLYLEGYDPRALVGFFERMHERKNEQPNPFFAFGRTHPYSLDRRDHVRVRLAQLQRWRPRNDLQLFARELRQLLVREAPKK